MNKKQIPEIVKILREKGFYERFPLIDPDTCQATYIFHKPPFVVRITSSRIRSYRTDKSYNLLKIRGKSYAAINPSATYKSRHESFLNFLKRRMQE